MTFDAIHAVVAIATPYLLFLALLSFALGVATSPGLRRERNGLTGPRRRLGPFDGIAFILAVCFFTLFGGAKEGDRGGSHDAEDVNTPGEALVEPARSLPPALAGTTNLLAFTSISVDSANHALAFGAAWATNLFDYAASRYLDLFMSTNLMAARWFWLGGFPMPSGATSHVFSVSGEDVCEGSRPAYSNSFSRSAFFRLGADFDSDGDGLTDAYEQMASLTDPGATDTDDDGLDDAAETALQTDPLARDTDGDGLVDGSDPDPLATTPLDDLDGDGLPDAYEIHWFGGTNVYGSASAFGPNGFNIGFELSSGMNPTNGAGGAFAAAGRIAAWKIADAFSTSHGGMVTNLYERTFVIARRGDWERFFISSEPDRAMGWALDGMTLEWEDSEGGYGDAAASPPGDSLYLPLSADSPYLLTIRLRQTAVCVSSSAPLYLLAYAPDISIGGTARITTPTAEWQYAEIREPATLQYTLVHTGRPCNAPLYPDEATFSLPPSDEWLIAFLDDGTLRVDGPGVFRLPSLDLESLSVPSRGTRTAPGSPSPVPGSPHGKDYWLALLDPSITYGNGHYYTSGGGLGYDSWYASYFESYEYPIDSECLWRAWHSDSTGAFVCDCQPEIHTSVDLSEYPDIATDIAVTNDTATGTIYIGGTNVWAGAATHYVSSYSGGYSGGAELLSDDGCGDCASCEDGNCDGLEGDEVGSVKFRIPLGVPRSGQVSGFAWLRFDWPQGIGVGTLQVAKRADATVTDTTSGGVRTIACADNRGRTLTVSPISGGVEVVVTDTASGSLVHTWRLTYWISSWPKGNVRFQKISRANNTMSDRTYSRNDSFYGGGWTVTDNISHTSREIARDANFEDGGEVRDEQTLRDEAGSVLSHTVSVSRRIGSFSSAVLRQTYYAEESYSNRWNESFASYYDDITDQRHGNVRLEWGNARPWHFTAYDAEGRTLLTLDQYNGSECPTNTLLAIGAGAFDDADPLEWLATLDVTAIATVFDYTPVAGDDASPSDVRKPRMESRHLVADGSVTLIGRTWTRHTHGTSGGHPTVTVETITAGAQDAAITDARNAISVTTSYDEDAPGIPLQMRGAPVSSLDSDGILTTFDYSSAGNVLTTVERRFKNGVEAPVRAETERDMTYGNLLAERSVHNASGIAFDEAWHLHDDKNRRVSTRHGDGSWTTNAYSCCRLLWSQGRDGAKVLRSATTGQDHLYYAMEEVSLKDLPHYISPDMYQTRIVPYGHEHPAHANKSIRVTQHFMDPIGRETNAIVRTCKVNDGVVNYDLSIPGWHASSTHAYPFGTSDYEVATDQRGNVNTTIRTATAEAEITQVITSQKTTTTTSYRNGDTITEVATAPSPSNPSAPNPTILNSQFSILNSDGTRITYSITSTPNSSTPPLTNSVTYTDFLGRTVRTITPLSDVTYSYDGPSSRVLSTFDSISGLVVTNLYDDLGEHVGQISSRVESRTDTAYEVVSNVLWRSILQTISTPHSSTPPLSNSSTSTVHCASCIVHYERLSGLSSALRSESATFINGVPISRTTSSFAGSILTETTVSATSGTNIVRRQFGRVVSTTGSAGTTLNFFDPFGRVFFTTHDDKAVRWIGRNSLGDICEQDMVYARRFESLDDFHVYDQFGNRIATTNAIGAVTHYAYDAGNRLVATGGAVYPTLYTYDAFGRRTSLSTTRDPATSQLSTFQPFNFSTGVWDETRWSFDPNTGLCTNKTYADGSSVTYTYTPDGKPLRTTYPSGRWKENAYDSNRRLVSCRSASSGSVGFKPAETNDVFFAYDVFGRRVAESNSIASVTYLRDIHGNCTNETAITSGQTNTIERAFDAYGRLTHQTLGASAPSHDPANPGNPENPVQENSAFLREIIYAPDGKISSISNAEAFVEYAYTPDRLHAGYTLTLANGTVFTRHLVRDTYRRDLILYITNSVNGVAIDTFAYTYDALGRPVTRNADAFAYNDRSEVVSSRWGAGSAEDSYAYDGIGNLLDHVGNGLTNTYAANCLNQYTSVSNLCGSVPLCEPSYDTDGNLLTNGVFSYAYDASSRLASVSSNGVLLASFAYDAQGRRVRKVSHRGTETRSHTYFYDGWTPVRETATDLSTLQPFNSSTEYVWGKDLSGSIGGAGGVGGLLYVSIPNSFTPNSSTHQLYIPLYDANGNITHYCDASGNVVASYAYDAFGNTVAQSGAMADTFPHRFSTKYFDTESGLYYYGYRFYLPEFMRWINRDPIEEDGGANLYAFCENDGVCRVDSLGNSSEALGFGMGIGFRVGFNAMGQPMYAAMLMGSAQQALCDRLRVKADIGIRFFRGGAIGTPRSSSDWFYETYYSISGTIGGGKRGPTPYFVNGLQWGSLLGDTYQSSFSAGQTFYYNSALRESNVRMGLLRFQSSGFFLNYNNDQRHFPYGLGDGGDRGWTGGGALGFSVGDGNFAVVGFDDFSGRADKTISFNPDNPNSQSEYSTSLNQAQWTLGVADEIGRSLGFSIDAPNMFNVQHWIHSTISKEAGYFDYPDDIKLNIHATGVIVPIK